MNCGDALAFRLGRLRQPPGAATRPLSDRLPDRLPDPERRSPELQDLLRRVESMRRKSLPGNTRGSSTVASELGGQEIAPGLVAVDRHHPLAQPFGRRTLGQWIHLARPMLESVLATDAESLCFIDTETSGLAGGTGTIAWMIGIGRIESARFTTRQYVLTAFGAEAAMLGTLLRDIGKDSTLVTFNGRSFDLPLLATRLRLNRLPPLPPACHLDLLHPLRRRYRSQLANCRLGTLETHLLGNARQDEVAGSEAPAIWNALLAGRRPDRRLEGMARHNRIDLLAMAALLHQVDRA